MVQSVERAANILKVVANRSSDGSSLAMIVKDTGLNRATAHRLLQTLIRAGMIEYDQESGRYFPGLCLVGVAGSAGNRYGLVSRSMDGRARIAERTGDTVFLTLRVGAAAVCVARTEGSFPIKALTLNVGETRPLGVGAGSLAILAFLGADERARILAQSADDYSRYGTDKSTLMAAVERTRVAGFALDEGNILPGITGIGVPISGGADNAIAGLSIAALSDRLTGQRQQNAVSWLLTEARKIEAELAPVLRRTAAGAWHGVLGHGTQ